ncbi:hypothetical protein BVRB_4g083770 [Beta vulgaris subsp. vulgaris]|nr:hypothetical protein BVRB_4g083770 [Beta vulgaris subsp. vulgaris]
MHDSPYNSSASLLCQYGDLCSSSYTSLSSQGYGI